MLEKIEKWWQRISLPENVDDVEAWQSFAKKAKRWQVEELYEKEFEERQFKPFVLTILLKRLWQVEWPVLDDEYVLKYKSMMRLKLPYSTIEMEALEHQESDGPQYLIDVNNRVLGIIISKTCVITKIYNHKVDYSTALEMKDELLSDDEVIELLAYDRYKLSDMLAGIGMGGLHGRYWFGDGISISQWDCESVVFRTGEDSCEYAHVLGKEIF